MADIFLSTPSARRATEDFRLHYICTMISIHALREEGDCGGDVLCVCHKISIHALREEGDGVLDLLCEVLHPISIHALREEGDQSITVFVLCFRISIHALREEGDLNITKKWIQEHISIHALREEGDKVTISTLSTRSYFYPRPPRGGRRLRRRYA